MTIDILAITRKTLEMIKGKETLYAGDVALALRVETRTVADVFHVMVMSNPRYGIDGLTLLDWQTIRSASTKS